MCPRISIPVTQPLAQGPRVQPFLGKGFHATSRVGIIPVNLDKIYDKATFDTGLLTGCENGNCGRVGVISRMKAAMGQPGSLIPFLEHMTARAALGTPSSPALLRDEDVLSPAETREVSGRIREFQKAILELVFTDEADPRLEELRKEGRVHVFDLNYLLYCLNTDGLLAMGAEPSNGYSIKSLLDELSSPISNQDRASLIADADAVRAYFDEYLNQKMLRTVAQGGIVGPDFVHPTPAGHAVIAAGVLALMKSAALRVPSGAEPSFAGYSAETLAALYAEALAEANTVIQGDKWVIPARKGDWP